jgi:L-asparaginase/Glu-tRNA(Gln) amidotransferase subunit D
MTKPRVYLFSLGGTIATEPGKQGMKVGLGADDLLRAVPDLEAIADIRAEALSRTAAATWPSTTFMRWPSAFKRWRMRVKPMPS